MYISSNIAVRIKELSKKNNVTIKKMLSDCNLGFNMMANLKKSMPKADTLAKIADYLNCSVDYLLGRTDNPEFKPYKKIVFSPGKISKEQEVKTKLLSLYEQPASAGSGNWLDYDNPVTYMTVVQDEQSMRADYMVKVQGDSMLPRFSDGDIVLIKKTPSIDIGSIGIFTINGDCYIKKMGQGELISVNPKYPNIPLHDTDDVRCAGEVIGVANCV